MLSYWLQFDIWELTDLVFFFFSYKPFKAKIEGVDNILFCCYGSLLSRVSDNNVLTNGWALI